MDTQEPRERVDECVLGAAAIPGRGEPVVWIPITWGQALKISLAQWTAWGGLAVIIIWMDRRLPIERDAGYLTTCREWTGSRASAGGYALLAHKRVSRSLLGHARRRALPEA